MPSEVDGQLGILLIRILRIVKDRNSMLTSLGKKKRGTKLKWKLRHNRLETLNQCHWHPSCSLSSAFLGTLSFLGHAVHPAGQEHLFQVPPKVTGFLIKSWTSLILSPSLYQSLWSGVNPEPVIPGAWAKWPPHLKYEVVSRGEGIDSLGKAGC